MDVDEEYLEPSLVIDEGSHENPLQGNVDEGNPKTTDYSLSLPCHLCLKVFSNSYHLQKHVEAHSKSMSLNQNERLEGLMELQGHIKTHQKPVIIIRVKAYFAVTLHLPAKHVILIPNEHH